MKNQTKKKVAMRIRYYIFALTFSLVCTATAVAQQAEKILVKSFNLHGNQVVELNLDGPVEVKTWDSDLMRIQMTVAISNGSEAMLKSLLTAGRYNLISSEEEAHYEVSAPNLQREVMLRGNPLVEKISYLVFAPKDVVVKLANEAETQLEPAEKPSSR